MSTFFTFLEQLFSFHLYWIFGFIMSNLFWVFAFSALIYFLFDGKKMLIGFVLIVLDVWIWADFGLLSGVGIFSAQVLALYYISKIGILAMVESSSKLRKHFVVISSITGILTVLIANIIA